MKHMFVPFASLVLALVSCGDVQESASSLKEDRSATFGFQISTSGDVTFGTPYRRELEMRLNEVVSSRGSSENSERSSWSDKKEKLEKDKVKDSNDNCFSFEAARDHGLDVRDKPAITVQSAYEAHIEEFHSRLEAERALGHRVQVLKDNLHNLKEANQGELTALKAAVKVGALTHNKEFAQAAYIASRAVDAAAGLGSEFKSAPFSEFGNKVRYLSAQIADAGKKLPEIYSGTDLAHRKDVLSKAGKVLTVADAVFAEGDVTSADYLLNVALTLADIAVGTVPLIGWAKDIQEAVTGYNIIMGRKLTPVERSFAIVGAVTGGVGSKLQTHQKAFNALMKFHTRCENTTDAMAALKAAGKTLKIPGFH